MGRRKSHVPVPSRIGNDWQAFQRSGFYGASVYAASFVPAGSAAGHFVSAGTEQTAYLYRAVVPGPFAGFHVRNWAVFVQFQNTSFDGPVYGNGSFGDNRSEEKMSQIRNGSDAPDFTLRDGDGQDWNLGENKGKTVVLLFYPGDNTPVCTAQLCSVRDHWSEYQATGAEVVGISTDTVDSHKGFAEKNRLPLRLLSDPDGKVSTA